MKQTEYKGLRFGTLSREGSDEMQKAMLNGLKAINEYFDSGQTIKKLMVNDIKVATTAVNAYANLRQSDNGYAMILLQLAKFSQDGKKALNSFIIEAIPQLTEPTKKKLKG